MVKGPILYSDIGKKARDLLYKDYLSDHKVTITSQTPTGLAINATATKNGDAFLAGFSTQLKNENITTNVKLDANSNAYNNFQLSTNVTVDEPAAGLKTILNFTIPDHRHGKVELQYQNECAAISTSLGLTAYPIVNFSGVFGNNNAACGIDLSFDTASGNFTKSNVGLSFFNDESDWGTASLTLNNKGDNLTASYCLGISPGGLGVEYCLNLLSQENTLTIGMEEALNPTTLLKSRFNNHGKASALIHRDWNPRTRFTISGEVDITAIERSLKVGLALALKP